MIYYFEQTCRSVLSDSWEFHGQARKQTNQSSKKWIHSRLNEKTSLKLSYFGHVIQTPRSLEKAQLLGKMAGKRRRRWPGTRCVDGLNYSVMGIPMEELKDQVRDRPSWRKSISLVVRRTTWWHINQSVIQKFPFGSGRMQLLGLQITQWDMLHEERCIPLCF